MQVLLVDGVRQRHLLQHSARQDGGVFLLFDLGEENDEFIAALAADGVGGANTAEQALGDGLEQLVRRSDVRASR